MLKIALTGNIAAGKSTVVSFLARWGATIVDADELAREAQAPGTDVLAAIGRRFGTDVLSADGSLDRAALRSKILGDEAALRALNAIVHPAVQERRDELLRAARARGDLLVINDIPLLFEVLDPARFDVIVLVDAPLALRRARLRARGLTDDDADRMLLVQMPAERKRDRSTFVIDNTGSLEDLEREAHRVFLRLRQRAAAAALGHPTGPLLVVVADARDTPRAFGAVAERYREAGVPVTRIASRALRSTLSSLRPRVVLASARAARAARSAWDAAGRPGVFLSASRDPDPVAVRLDVRPWGAERLALAEADAAGLPPRADLFPAGDAALA